MNRLAYLLQKCAIVAITFFLLTSCNKEIEDAQTILKTEERVKTAIFNSMKEWYFWTSQLPETINPGNYATNNDLLADIIHKPLDRWSYLTTQEAFNRAFTGQNAGHGFGWGLDENEHLYILFVYKEAPAGMDGWERGWRVLEINNKPISEYKTADGYDFQIGPNTPGLINTFKFRLPDGSEITKTIDKKDYQSNSVLLKTVFETGGKKIGYWVYNSFRASPNAQPANSMSFEVDETFNYFQSAGINELIIDLRYNGGGSVTVTRQILNYLAPNTANGNVMYTNTHNARNTNHNSSATFVKKGNLNLPRLFVITSRSSASASELLINVLEPYMEVILIGANTYGKPVGAFPLSGYNRTLLENNVELVPITFSIANKNGRAEYFDGFPVHVLAADDPAKNWGDPTERRLKAALDYIMTGSPIAPGGRLLTYEPQWEMIDAFHGLLKEFPAY